MLKKALEDHNNIMPCLIHSLFVSEKTNITFIYEACSENLAVNGNSGVGRFCIILTSCHVFVECVYLLLAHDAPVKVKNNLGWSPLAEAISYGDRQISKFNYC